MARNLSQSDGFSKYLTRTQDLSVKSNSMIKNVPEGKVQLIEPKKNKIVLINPGEKVRFDSALNPKPSTTYNVHYRGEIHTIHYSFLVKPGRETLPSLKPQQYGVIGNFKTIDSLVMKIYDGIKKNEFQYSTELSHYLKCLVSLFSYKVARKCGFRNKKHVEQTITANWKTWKQILPVNDIGKDFAEMLGPLWVKKVKFFRQGKALINIEFPAAGNYPLVDYLMEFKYKNGLRVQKKYSAKSNLSARSNTVKMTSVLSDINGWQPRRRTEFLKRWGDSWVYELCVKTDEWTKSKKTNIKTVNAMSADWVSKKLKVKISGSLGSFWTEINKKARDEIYNFFVDFAQNNIYYVVFDIDNNGLPDFKMDIEALKDAKITLKEMSEQLGFSTKWGDVEP